MSVLLGYEGGKEDTWDFNWSWKPGFLDLREEVTGIRRRQPSMGTPGSWERRNGGGLYRKDSVGLESRDCISVLPGGGEDQ